VIFTLHIVAPLRDSWTPYQRIFPSSTHIR